MFPALPPGVPVPLREVLTPMLLPVTVESVAAGFPSPADDYVDASIDLNVELIPCPTATFFMRVEGDALRGDGICDGDLLVIDRSVLPRAGLVVVAVLAGQFVLRRLVRTTHGLSLIASDGQTPSVLLSDDEDSAIWGVVIHAIHHLSGSPARR